MGLAALNYPVDVTSDADRYRYLYAALEAVRLKHNEKAGDLSDLARAHRKRCTDLSTVLLDEVIRLRSKVRAPGYVTTPVSEGDPLLIQLRADGIKAHATVDVKSLTGTDLDARTL